MKIILISDIHITDKTETADLLKKVHLMRDTIVHEIEPGETMVFVTCGDIIDYSTAGRDTVQARQLFDTIKKTFNAPLYFVPGNHDLCGASLTQFDNFINRYAAKEHLFEMSSTYSVICEGVNLIFTNSIDHRDYSYGKLDNESISNNIKGNMLNILFCHNSLINERDDDKDGSIVLGECR
jgi:UDP-2,3-diacylglucosamine pyrophosphatase LpxH